MKKYLITVIVEHSYSKKIEAKSLKQAEKIAAELNIQDDDGCYEGTETMKPYVTEAE